MIDAANVLRSEIAKEGRSIKSNMVVNFLGAKVFRILTEQTEK